MEIFEKWSKFYHKTEKNEKIIKISSATVRLAERSPDALNSRMRLAKGFFLPVFVAQIGDLPLPCTIGAASAPGSPEAFFKEISIF